MNKKSFDFKGGVPIEVVEFKKVEAKFEGGIARVAQRVELATSKLAFNYIDVISNSRVHIRREGTSVVLRGDAGLEPWNKAILEYEGRKFVLAPIDRILGWETPSDEI